MSKEINLSKMQENVVRNFYNSKVETGLDKRNDSRIVHLRNFNNWVKSVLIKEHVNKLNYEKRNKELRVIDLACGRGGDIKKWKMSRNVNYVLFTDIAEISLNECERRYNEAKPRFTATFKQMDLTTETIGDKIKDDFDLISCQFMLHYSFESFQKANKFMENVSKSLTKGGYFIGTTTDSFEIIKLFKESKTNTFGNDVYNIKYLSNENELSTQPPLFGAKIDFQLDGVVDCPEYLVHFPTLVKIAEKHNLKVLWKKRFADFFDEYSKIRDYSNLIKIIKPLELYDVKNLKSKIPGDYEHVSKCDSAESDYYTLSKSEWEALNLYICFAFQKI
jgi:mRNA (guanine-N7-)-methyltransferase